MGAALGLRLMMLAGCAAMPSEQDAVLQQATLGAEHANEGAFAKTNINANAKRDVAQVAAVEAKVKGAAASGEFGVVALFSLSPVRVRVP